MLAITGSTGAVGGRVARALSEQLGGSERGRSRGQRGTGGDLFEETAATGAGHGIVVSCPVGKRSNIRSIGLPR